MNKTHFVQNHEDHSACGRYVGSRTRTTATANRVTCLNCQESPVVEQGLTDHVYNQTYATAYSEPRTVTSPWGDGAIKCRFCGGGLFLDAGRSLDTFNHICAACGKMSHTLTETGMSA